LQIIILKKNGDIKHKKRKEVQIEENITSTQLRKVPPIIQAPRRDS
jgi:hypothetical protein